MDSSSDECCDGALGGCDNRTSTLSSHSRSYDQIGISTTSSHLSFTWPLSLRLTDSRLRTGPVSSKGRNHHRTWVEITRPFFWKIVSKSVCFLFFRPRSEHTLNLDAKIQAVSRTRTTPIGKPIKPVSRIPNAMNTEYLHRHRHSRIPHAMSSGKGNAFVGSFRFSCCAFRFSFLLLIWIFPPPSPPSAYCCFYEIEF